MKVKSKKTGKLVTLVVGMRVAPSRPTKNAIEYGYVREVFESGARPNNGPHALVFWPQLRDAGDNWQESDLIAL